MNIYKIIGRIALLSLVLALYSCAEDKYYDLGGYSSGRVVFTAINLNTSKINEAESSKDDDYYYYPYRNLSFSLTAYTLGWYDNDGEIRSSEYTISLDRESTIWAGGYNDIEITFQPTSPEEKEATFTMPDGSVVTATADKPTIIWHTDSLIGKNYRDTYIKAESSFKKGNTEHHNVGYIYLNINPDFRYNKLNEKWYISGWTNGGHLEEKTYTKFSAENLQIKRDSCSSFNQNFYNTITKRNETFMIPYYDADGSSGMYDFTLRGNDIFVFGENDVRFTFHPTEGEQEMSIYLPNNNTITLTRDNPSYVWHVSRSDINSFSYNNPIYILGNSGYYYQGIYYYGQSEIKMYFSGDIWYNSGTNRFVPNSSY